MINVILATHGPLAEALMTSCRMVYGEMKHIFPVMLKETDDINHFRDKFADVLTRASLKADGILVLCDLQSGTPWNVACYHAFNSQTQPPVAVIAGVNFPMLLLTDDLTDYRSAEQAAHWLLTQTRESLVQAVPADTQSSDDF